MASLRDSVRNSNSPLIRTLLGLRKSIHHAADHIYFASSTLVYFFCKLLPLQDKIVASTFWGRKYGDNTQFILEELHRLNPGVKIVWIRNFKYKYDVPGYMKVVSHFAHWRVAFEYATAKAWLDTHRFPGNARKRKGQLVIETWHGGLGIKKLDLDVPKFRAMKRVVQEINRTSALADLFVSNSTHLTRIYRSAFNFQGKIWKAGYPKNDALFLERAPFQKKIRDTYGIPQDTKILLYAPTFRDNFKEAGFDRTPFDIRFDKLQDALQERFGSEWKILVRWHPVMANSMKDIAQVYDNSVIDATRYPDMQELIMATDAMLSDYSSCIFDAAMLKMPCFMFATDFEDYKQDRGVYYELEDLPFPCGKNNDELLEHVKNFDEAQYNAAWKAFKEDVGLHETGHASKDIATVIDEFIKGNSTPLNEIQNDEIPGGING